MGKSIKKNYIYNLIYQITLIIVPIIATPYISRVLLAEGIGKYSFASSLISYFTLFASLGFSYYAQREIAKYQDDRKIQSKIFYEIMICRALSVTIAIVLNLLLAFLNVYGDYTLLMLLLTINIVSIGLDVAFYFQGNEEFGKIVLRSVIIKVLGLVSIFIFVKDKNDLWKYTLIQSLVGMLNALSLFPNLFKDLEKVKFKDLKPFKHLPGAIMLFIPTIAVSIYTVLDKTLIGVITNSNDQNGYYEQAERIVKMSMTIVTCLGAVMIPKNSFYFQNKDFRKINENIYKAINFVLILGMPIMFGLMAVANNFSPWFFGSGYDEVPALIMYLCPLIMAIGLNNIFGLQYLLPAGKDKIYTMSVTLGAVINLILNLILIPKLNAIGAAIASVIAEFFVLFFQYYNLRKEFSLKKILLMFAKYGVIGLTMFACVYALSIFAFAPSILNTLILVAIGIIVYCGILFVIRDKFFMEIINQLIAFIKKGRSKKNA